MTTPTPSIAQLNVGLPRDHGAFETGDRRDPLDRVSGGSWRSAIFKLPVEGPVFLSERGFDGDGQADLENHGGPDKAVCAYSADHYPEWRRTLGFDPFPYGAFGENLTVGALDEHTVCIGDVWSVGDAELQVSQPRQPCWKLGRKWALESLPHLVRSSGRTGWYFRVLRTGHVSRSARLLLVDRPHPEWSVAAANAVMHERSGDTRALASLEVLSTSWRDTLQKRLDVARSRR
jgi:MOSC domain-containing protein YiiM